MESRNYADDMDGTIANAMIYDSCEDALAGMDDDQRMIVEREAQHLIDCVPKLGWKGALELLASVAHLRGE